MHEKPLTTRLELFEGGAFPEVTIRIKNKFSTGRFIMSRNVNKKGRGWEGGD